MKRFVKRLINQRFQPARIRLFSWLNRASSIQGRFESVQPVLFSGEGEIIFGEGVTIGVINSPLFYSSYGYIEARSASARVVIGKNVMINNNFCLICDKTSIEIGESVLIGYNVSIFDSDFHPLDPKNRLSDNYTGAAVKISSNVFIGSNVTILKGVEIGVNSVIGSGSVVTKSFGSDLIIGGNPAKIIGHINP